MKPDRILALDVFRGLTMAAMLLVENPGSSRDAYPWLRHTSWGNNLTPTDLIFPFFIFVVGMTIPFSLGRRRLSGAGTKSLVLKIIRRSIILFILGLIFYLFPKFDFTNIRIPGVLQRIALTYLAGSLLFLKVSWRKLAVITGSILIIYWLVMILIPVPGIGAPSLEPEINLAAWLDTQVFGYSDPEGLLSTLPAICTCLLGILAGLWLQSNRGSWEKAIGLFIFGSALTFFGLVWDLFFPIIKDIWTSSYVLYTSGLALMFFTTCYWIVDVLRMKRWTKPLVAYGVNCISVYFVSHLVAQLLIQVIKVRAAYGQNLSMHTWIFKNIFVSWLSPANASLLFSFFVVLFWLAPLWIMLNKKIIIKI